MAPTTTQRQPDYAVPPGWVLEERLEAMDISQAEFARRCGRSPKLISQIIAGTAPLEPATAIQFERVLGVDATIWMGIESDYQLMRAKVREREKMAEAARWAAQFPIAQLVGRGAISKPVSREDRVQKLLVFFGVASVEAWEARQRSAAYAYRHSPTFKSDPAVLATWLRLGELEAEEIDCAPYSEARFREALASIREHTRKSAESVLEEPRRLCKEAGVALTAIQPLPKAALSGASRWLSPRKAAIHLTARHRSDDQLWFSLFHEAGHLLLHSKKETFVDEKMDSSDEADREADRWAADFLIPPQAWKWFVGSGPFTKASVEAFAQEQRIAPGIVVGRLQHEQRLPWKSQLNELKIWLQWDEGSA